MNTFPNCQAIFIALLCSPPAYVEKEWLLILNIKVEPKSEAISKGRNWTGKGSHNWFFWNLSPQQQILAGKWQTTSWMVWSFWKDFYQFFSSIWLPTNSHPPASSHLSHNSYQLGLRLASTSFQRDRWSKPTSSFRTAASHGSITHSEESAIYPVLHTWAHGCSWLATIAMIDRG